jgi:transcriptional regulator with PAS, ATPase and Fis domain
VVTISRNITELVRQEASVHGKQQNKTPMTVQKFISNAANIRFAIQHMDKLIGQRLSVLLLGETGTGKDYFAKFLHENAYPDPENRPFIKINCGAIPESLLESELFGYEKGAFTGASAKGKKGLIELANNGTLFLDEIGELPYNLQAKLLGVLQDKELTRVGGSEKIKINAKIISASNRDIFKMTQENKFRLDLYYRISMVTLHIPPLRERREDIPYLIDQLLREINQLYGKNAYLSLELYDLFFKYDWPGNIRELKNLMEKLIIFSSGDRIGIDDLRVAEKFLGHSETRILDLLPAEGKESRPRGLKEMVAAYEKNIIETALRDKRTLQEAAQYLGIDISTLVRKKSKYSI